MKKKHLEKKDRSFMLDTLGITSTKIEGIFLMRQASLVEYCFSAWKKIYKNLEISERYLKKI